MPAGLNVERHKVKRHIAGHGASTEGQSDVDVPGASALSMAPVLLAEDDEVHACIVEASLTNARLANPVVRARTGDEAAAYLATVNGGENPLPALVLLDLELPGQSGLCVLETLRGLGGGAGRCPVIMMSGSSDGATIARSRELGVRGYLVKPVAFDALVDVIHGLDLPWAILGGPEG